MRPTLLTTVTAVLITLAASCNSSKELLQAARPGQLLREPAVVVDQNKDPGIVEIDLRAAESQYEFEEGISTTVWTYNGSLPGPTIEARVGDELIVHFTNDLPEETTIHWHGIRLPADMDGTHLSQAPVPPGGSFEYRFVLPDAGTFWYHTHVNSTKQLPMGLYGLLIVRGPEEPEFTRERLLVLSDVTLDASWQVVPMDQTFEDQLDLALGPEGNTLLVNGQRRPRIELRPGSRERWRILNACGSRYFNLAVPGHSLTLIGCDSGLIESPVEMQQLLIAPAERYEVLLTATAEPGTGTTLQNLEYKRLHGFIYNQHGHDPLLDINYTDESPLETPPIPATLSVVPELPGETRQRFVQLTARVSPPLDQLLERDNTQGGHAMSRAESAARASSEHEHGHGGGHGVPGGASSFWINGQTFPDVPVFESELGTTEIWRINNHTEMDHPWHIHGFRFQVLDVNGEPWPYRGWKDTVNIPGSVFGDTIVRIQVDFSGFPGPWMHHCHILHHQEMGMMGDMMVE